MVWVLKKAGALLGYDVMRNAKSDRIARHLERYFATYRIGLVLDSGGNNGQFGLMARAAGYSGSILSFEPLPAAYANLAKCAAKDGNWRALMVGLGATSGTLTLNVSSGDTSLSSALKAEAAMLDQFPELNYASSIQVPVRRLDEVLDEEGVARDVDIFLKSDTQGFDLHVLNGMGERMAQVRGLLLEMSVLPLYEGAPSHWQMLDFAHEAGFEAYGFATVNRNQHGGMIEYDALFYRLNAQKRV